MKYILLTIYLLNLNFLTSQELIIGEKRVEALRVSESFRARVVDTTQESFVFELTGAKSKIDAFVHLMRPLGLKEVSRTGIAAIARGPEAM